MSQVDIVAIPHDVNYATFDDIRLGLSTQEVVGRLLRFWDARNIKKDGEFMGITLLFLDEKNSVIHGFIPAARSAHFRPDLREGSIVKLGGFEVGRCTNMFKVTDHPFVIRFLPTTTIVAVDDAAPKIKQEKFMLRNFDHLQALANTNLELPDVVGQILFIQGSNLNDPTSTLRLVVRFRVDTSVIVHLSLWDNAAATFRGHLRTGNTNNSVMIVTTVNPKLFGGNLYLNSTAATRFYFQTSFHAIQQFTKSLGIEGGEPFPQAETMGLIKKKEVVSIAELNNYLSKCNDQTQEADFLCKARIEGVLQNNGWSYVSCTACNRKLEKSQTALRCNKCISPNVTGVVRFRVELAVHDGHDGATFVVFDTEMTKLTRKTAATLTLEEGDGEGDKELPECFQELQGKHFLFHIRITPFNYTPKHRTFTVSTMTEQSPPENFSKGESSMEAKNVDTEVEEEITGQDNQDDETTLEMDMKQENQPKNKAENKNRKRNHE